MSNTDNILYKDEAESLQSKDSGFAIITILTIISIIIGILELIQGCRKKNAPLFTKEQFKSWLAGQIVLNATPSKRQVDRIVRRELTREQYAACGEKLVAEIIQRGLDMDETHLEELLDSLEE